MLKEKIHPAEAKYREKCRESQEEEGEEEKWSRGIAEL